MGWTTTHRARGEKMGDFFASQFNYEDADAGRSGRVLDCAVVTFTTAYLAYRIVTPDETRVVALVCLIKYYGDTMYNFGYKDMGESMGPGERACPRRILDQLTPLKEGDEYAREWRQDCYDNLDKRKAARKATRAIVQGTTIKLADKLRYGALGTHDTFTYCPHGTPYTRGKGRNVFIIGTTLAGYGQPVRLPNDWRQREFTIVS